MDKSQAIHAFWSSFGIKAYDANTVPDDAALPRITYEVSTGYFGSPVQLTASIWDRSTSWQSVEEICNAISRHLGLGGVTIPYDGGTIWLVKAPTFAQRMNDPDASIRRIVIILQAEFISED